MPEQRKPVFACDLDNTLIVSKKHFHEGWPCVEWIHEKEQAYMSLRTAETLSRVCEAFAFVPVTSRSVEQYRRIHFPPGCEPSLAVCANGAVLLRTGKDGRLEPDEDWERETRAAMAPWRAEMDRMEKTLSPDERFIRCRKVDEAYLFVYCAEGIPPEETAAEIREQTDLGVTASGKKIYLMPPFLHKGWALERLAAGRASGCRMLAAGDSAMDLPMLWAADYAIYPAALAAETEGRKGAIWDPGCGIPFSEFVTGEALAWLQKEKNAKGRPWEGEKHGKEIHEGE